MGTREGRWAGRVRPKITGRGRRLVLAGCLLVAFAPGQTHPESLASVKPGLRPPSHLFLNGGRPQISAEEVTFGEAAGPLDALVASLTIEGLPEGVAECRVSWEVRDFSGAAIHQVSEKRPAAEALARSFSCALPATSQAGPFRFHYEVAAGGQSSRGVIPISRADHSFLIEDFEKALRPASGNIRLDSASAHSGQFGLRVEPAFAEGDRQRLAAIDLFLEQVGSGGFAACRPAAEKLQAAGGAGRILQILDDSKLGEAEKLQQAREEAHNMRLGFLRQHGTSVPIGLELPGRPTRLCLWARADTPGGGLEVQVSALIENNQARHRWTVPGPALEGQGWKRLELDLPVYAEARARASPEALKSDPAAQGQAHYPLKLEAIALLGPGPASFDDLSVRTQETLESPVQVIAGGDKPGALLFPGDAFRIRVHDASLTAPLKAAWQAEATDLERRPVRQASWPIDLGPDGVQELEISTNGWPRGVYAIRLEAVQEGRTIYRNFTEQPTSPAFLGQRFILYRPDAPDLTTLSAAEFLRDGHRVELDLGKGHEVVPIQWHNSYPELRDGIEPREGMWMWHVYDPKVKQTVSAGKSIVARLGLTPAWASSEGRYDDMTGNRDWVGDPFTLPQRSVTWERYVYKVVKRYQRDVSIWEVWNKPDDPVFKTTAKEFTERVLKVAHRAARSASPKCRLLLGGITRDNLLPFLRDLFQCGGHQLVDAIGVHPSVDPLSPERAFLGEMLEEACRLAEKAGAADKLWITELGWNTGRPGDVSEMEQAQYLCRAFVLARLAGIRRILIDLHTAQWEQASSGLLFQTPSESGFIHYRLGALAFKHLARALPEEASPLGEIDLRDRSLRLSRAGLFQLPEGLLLVVWRETGTARMPAVGGEVQDMLGNPITPREGFLDISAAPLFIRLPGGDLPALRRRLERLPLQFKDDPASRWKMALHTFADVGDPADEQAAGYAVTGRSVISTLTSTYLDKRSLKDSGRNLHESESLRLPLQDAGARDLILKRRIDYELKDQKCRVSVDGKEVGVWLVPGQDRTRRWRDEHFIIPNSFLSGKGEATLTLSAVTGPYSTFSLAAGLKEPGTLFLSDIQPLVDTEGWIGPVRSDTSFLHSPLSIQKKSFAKGLGVHAPSLLVYNLNRQFRRFHFQCGLDDVTEGKGSVAFRVLADQKTLYDSHRVNAFSRLDPQEVDVTDAQVLQLVVEDGGDGKENDVADWANARLSDAERKDSGREKTHEPQ
ncbi:MAG: NPCBM/NEW2 domain-containing protein [Planctomycetes bacterium]|nr:NPCBM/NEW2 domain-containing protein [Planctomycetota bacterium]